MLLDVDEQQAVGVNFVKQPNRFWWIATTVMLIIHIYLFLEMYIFALQPQESICHGGNGTALWVSIITQNWAVLRNAAYIQMTKLMTMN